MNAFLRFDSSGCTIAHTQSTHTSECTRIRFADRVNRRKAGEGLDDDRMSDLIDGDDECSIQQLA